MLLNGENIRDRSPPCSPPRKKTGSSVLSSSFRLARVRPTQTDRVSGREYLMWYYQLDQDRSDRICSDENFQPVELHPIDSNAITPHKSPTTVTSALQTAAGQYEESNATLSSAARRPISTDAAVQPALDWC
ncbi:hypothetical protein MMC22_000672 [Lobaria immixta]|nr:hypothetical protein [Lobaria immixta]